jgi:hypothetical protein
MFGEKALVYFQWALGLIGMIENGGLILLDFMAFT